MTIAELYSVVSPLAEQVLHIPKFDDATNMISTPAWDSLRHIQLLGAVERKFGIEISGDDSFRLTSADKLVQYLHTRLQHGGAGMTLSLLPHQQTERPVNLPYSNYFDLLKAHTERDPGRAFLLFPESGREYTYWQFFRIALSAADWLTLHRSRPEDHCAWCCATRQNFLQFTLAPSFWA